MALVVAAQGSWSVALAPLGSEAWRWACDRLGGLRGARGRRALLEFLVRKLGC